MPDPAADGRPELAPIVLVTGKGGVGKTTLAAGLAEAAVRRDGAAVLVEFGDGESGKRVLGRKSAVERVVLKPHQAMSRVATELLHSAILAKVAINNFAVKRLLRACPSVREFASLECVRMLAEERPGQRIVVDMPSTGHGVAWLRMPAQLRDLLRSGTIQAACERLAEQLTPGRCSVVVVSLPERLVLAETIELCNAMANDVGLPPDRLVINRVPARMPKEALIEARQIAAGNGKLANAARPLVEALKVVKQAHVGLDHHLTPALLPEMAVDPKAAKVADWLRREGQA